MESERFRDSLLAGNLPLKVVDRLPDPSRVFPFEHLVAEHADAPAWLRRCSFAETWRRFRDEFLALPSLEDGLSAFLGLSPAPGLPSATRLDLEVKDSRRPLPLGAGEGVVVEV
jgi:hypothetical protein